MEINLEILRIAVTVNNYGSLDNLVKTYKTLYDLVYESQDNN